MQKPLLMSSGSQPILGQESAAPEDTSTTTARRPVQDAGLSKRVPSNDPLLTAEQVADRLNVSKDWVWDHSSRKAPLLPVIRMGDGTLRYRASKIEEFINERERLSYLRRKRG